MRRAERDLSATSFGNQWGSRLTYYLIKIFLSATLVVLISEITKRSTLAGSILASIPLVSVLAMCWLYLDTKDEKKVSELASGIFWLVLPSLALFVTLPLFIRYGLGFYASLGLSVLVTVACYYFMISTLSHYDINL